MEYVTNTFLIVPAHNLSQLENFLDNLRSVIIESDSSVKVQKAQPFEKIPIFSIKHRNLIDNQNFIFNPHQLHRLELHKPFLSNNYLHLKISLAQTLKDSLHQTFSVGASAVFESFQAIKFSKVIDPTLITEIFEDFILNVDLSHTDLMFIRQDNKGFSYSLKPFLTQRQLKLVTDDFVRQYQSEQSRARQKYIQEQRSMNFTFFNTPPPAPAVRQPPPGQPPPGLHPYQPAVRQPRHSHPPRSASQTRLLHETVEILQQQEQQRLTGAISKHARTRPGSVLSPSLSHPVLSQVSTESIDVSKILEDYEKEKASRAHTAGISSNVYTTATSVAPIPSTGTTSAADVPPTCTMECCVFLRMGNLTSLELVDRYLAPERDRAASFCKTFQLCTQLLSNLQKSPAITYTSNELTFLNAFTKIMDRMSTELTNEGVFEGIHLHCLKQVSQQDIDNAERPDCASLQEELQVGQQPIFPSGDTDGAKALPGGQQLQDQQAVDQNTQCDLSAQSDDVEFEHPDNSFNWN